MLLTCSGVTESITEVAMAHIDNLIAAVRDPHLRAALQAEYRQVSATRRYGLVFDRHQPESVLLPGFEIDNGHKVQVLANGVEDQLEVDGTGTWTVVALNRYDGTVLLRDADGNTRTELSARLVAIREFGDTIYPGLRSTGRVLRGGGIEGEAGDKPFHAVINSENYHALETLLYPYEGCVDAIYIDPPYNTGARDWKYNNDYVDDNDPYRHSKWLSFMEKRLELAKRLLNPSKSVLIVTIDEKELHRLGLLLEQVFPRQRAQMVSITINHRGVARQKEFSRVEEYAFFLFIGDAGPCPSEDDMLSKETEDQAFQPIRWERLLRGGGNSPRHRRPNLFYPVFVDAQARRIVEVGEPIPIGMERSSVPDRPGLATVWPLATDGAEKSWQNAPAKLRDLVSKGMARVGSDASRLSIQYLGEGQRKRVERGEIRVTGTDGNGVLLLEEIQRSQRAAMTIWNRAAHNAGYYGSGLLKDLLPDRRFPFPKSLYAVEDCLRFAVGDNPRALVLDFFAGSGTTLHAVARLNHADGGRRRSIIITNNEVSADERIALRGRGLNPGDPGWEALGICQHITIPRVRTAITGRMSTGKPITGDYKFVDVFPVSDGLDENVEFFELTYEDAQLVALGRRFNAIAPLLWMKAGATGVCISDIDPAGWALPDDATYGVLFEVSAMPKFVAAAAAREDSPMPLNHLFVVTDSPVEFQQIAARLDRSIEVSQLYSTYLHSFVINKAR
jgi:adenine-specific DNA-methyltransferase